MHFDLHLRGQVRRQIADLATTMKDWEANPRLSPTDEQQIRDRLLAFAHCRERPGLQIAGVDGSGDYPALSYADAFVYFSVAQGAVYAADAGCGLREVAPTPETVFHFTWLPGNEAENRASLDQAFGSLAGLPLLDCIQQSDYRELKARHSRTATTPTELLEQLIRPHAADAGNLGIQLRSAAELGAALRLLARDEALDYVLVDGTFALPFIGRRSTSLFYEHLKRLCCVRARERGTGFLALSKSHGLPGIETLEALARERVGSEGPAEHWALRLPVPGMDAWIFPLVEERLLPPPGAVTYLVRFHRNVPVLRLDLDRVFWEQRIQGRDEEETRAHERRLFEDLDYTGHDHRCYGYPYPIKAGHDRASLTQPERVALRKMIIDAAVAAGMKRSLFRSASAATGHE